MSWENTNDLYVEEPKAGLTHDNQTYNNKQEKEQLQKEALQLKKFQDPIQDIERQAYISLLQQFGDYITSNNIQEMIKTILTDDCKFFIFSSTGQTPVRYCVQPNKLCDLYRQIKMVERRVRETYVDLEKATAIQLSNYKTIYQGKEEAVEEIVAEVFTIKDNKISKYRAFFAKLTPAHEQLDPFESTPKSRSIQKVKELNCALAGEPDFAKVASLFHEKTEYKIWSWDDMKILTFTKHDIATRFRMELEENYVIKRIVPYEVYTEAKFVYATYVYHLEGRSKENANQKFVWLSTCIFTFDNDANITKIRQQGELHKEGEVTIPYAVYPREVLIQTTLKLLENCGPSVDSFFQDLADFNCLAFQFGSDGLPNVGVFHGITKVKSMIADFNKGKVIIEEPKACDIFVDNQGPNYDVVMIIPWGKGKISYPEYKHNDLLLDVIPFSIFSMENGKLVRSIHILADFPKPETGDFDEAYDAIASRERKDFKIEIVMK